jgi:polysaccharide export outer membrane protein
MARIVLALCSATWGLAAWPLQDPVKPSGAPETPVADARYVLGADDQISIWVLGLTDSFGKPFKVDESGYVDLPMIGRVRAADRTIEQFKADLVARLRDFVNDPQVSVTVSELHSQPVSILGAVNTPGVHQLQGRKTLMEMLSAAGGLRADAGKSVKVTRAPAAGASPNDPNSRPEDVIDVSVSDLLAGNATAQNIIIRPHDVITVPRAEMVYVVGEVTKAGGFLLNEHETMSTLQALSLAGGLSPNAAPGYARILRTTKGSPERAEVRLDLKKILSSKANDVPLQSGDILFVPNSAAKAAGRRAVDAAVQLAIGVAVFHR